MFCVKIVWFQGGDAIPYTVCSYHFLLIRYQGYWHFFKQYSYSLFEKCINYGVPFWLRELNNVQQKSDIWKVGEGGMSNVPKWEFVMFHCVILITNT
jgi:hypothetical protein